MLIQITTGDWNNHFERLNMKVDEENGKAVGMVMDGIGNVGSFFRS